MSRRLAVASLDLLVDFLTMHRNITRSLDPESDLIAVNAQNLHRDHSIDHDALIDLAAKNQHGGQGCGASGNRRKRMLGGEP